MTHQFFSKAYRSRLVIPNYIVVKSQTDDDDQYSGSAQDDSYDLLPIRDYKQMRLESNDQADDIAEAILSQHQLWSDGGAADVPLNVGSEVFDYVNVVDAREGDERAGNIGSLTRHYNAEKAEWRMTFSFGNWMTVRKALAGLDSISTDDIAQYFSQLTVKDLYVENIQADNIDMVWLDPDGNVDLSLIGGTLDDLPDGENYARVRALHLDAAGLTVSENTLYYLNYNSEDGEKTFWKSSSAPTDPAPAEGDFWLDTSGEGVLKRYNGSSWVEASDAQKNAVLGGVLYQRTKSSSLTADGLVILDKLYVDDSEGTYGLVKQTDISAGHILLSECDGDLGDIGGDLDDIDDGSTYEKVKATSISAGHIELNSNIRVDGEWYSEGYIVIDDEYGILIGGDGGTSDLEFERRDYDHFIYPTNTGLAILSDDSGTGLDLLGGDKVTCWEDLVPGSDGTKDLGYTGTRWARGYFDNIYVTNEPWDDVDDLALIRKIKAKAGSPHEFDAESIPAGLRPQLQLAKKEQSLIESENKVREALTTAITHEKREKKKAKLQKALNKVGKGRAKKLAKIEQDFNSTPNNMMSVGGSISITIGAIKQLADKLDVLEAKIDALSK